MLECLFRSVISVGTCEKVWGGSPVTEQMETDLPASTPEPQNTSLGNKEVGENVDEESPQSDDHPTSDQLPDISELSNQSVCSSVNHPLEELKCSSSSNQTRFKRRHVDVQDYKRRKLKRKVSADTQILIFAEKEINLKENMMKKMRIWQRMTRRLWLV